jgi:hypothetical protein
MLAPFARQAPEPVTLPSNRSAVVPPWLDTPTHLAHAGRVALHVVPNELLRGLLDGHALDDQVRERVEHLAGQAVWNLTARPGEDGVGDAAVVRELEHGLEHHVRDVADSRRDRDGAVGSVDGHLERPPAV